MLRSMSSSYDVPVVLVVLVVGLAADVPAVVGRVLGSALSLGAEAPSRGCIACCDGLPGVGVDEVAGLAGDAGPKQAYAVDRKRV